MHQFSTMDNFTKLKELISKSPIPPAEQFDLIMLFSKAKDEELVDVVELFSSDLMWVNMINGNFKDKLDALKNKDLSAWHKIIEDEKKILEEIENDNLVKV